MCREQDDDECNNLIKVIILEAQNGEEVVEDDEDEYRNMIFSCSYMSSNMSL